MDISIQNIYRRTRAQRQTNARAHLFILYFIRFCCSISLPESWKCTVAHGDQNGNQIDVRPAADDVMSMVDRFIKMPLKRSTGASDFVPLPFFPSPSMKKVSQGLLEEDANGAHTNDIWAVFFFSFLERGFPVCSTWIHASCDQGWIITRRGSCSVRQPISINLIIFAILQGLTILGPSLIYSINYFSPSSVFLAPFFFCFSLSSRPIVCVFLIFFSSFYSLIFLRSSFLFLFCERKGKRVYSVAPLSVCLAFIS